jgi:hypothetical protein
MAHKWQRPWSRLMTWIRGLFGPTRMTSVYINRSGEKPYYQKLTCEHQARSSTGPVARHGGRRR